MWFQLKLQNSFIFPLRQNASARLSREQRQRLVSAIILSCSVVLAGLPASFLAPLQRVFNDATRFVADLHPRDHMWREHYAIYIGFRSKLELHTNCAPWCMRLCIWCTPVYIRNMLTSVTELPGRSHLRSAASGLYDVPRTRTKIWDQIVLSCQTDSMECSAT